MSLNKLRGAIVSTDDVQYQKSERNVLYLGKEIVLESYIYDMNQKVWLIQKNAWSKSGPLTSKNQSELEE